MGYKQLSALIASFQENYQDLLRFLTQRTGDPDRAADVAQETYLKLAAVTGGNVIENPRAYVYRVADNLAIDVMRGDARRGARQVAAETGEAVADLAPSPETALWSRERLDQLDKALGELPPKARLALLYFRLDGLSHAEIAARLGVSQSMVAKYIAQALRHCRDRLRLAEQN
jgi:RNA polymerase sigma-70 factor (ECF subfamily)/transmembrane sensor